MDEVKPKVYSPNQWTRKNVHIKILKNPWMNLANQIVQFWTSKMLETSYPKTNKGQSSLWMRDSASYKSNLWMNKASNGKYHS